MGDAPLGESLQAMVEAAKEAVANAARHSGAKQVSVYMEVEGAMVNIFVRDDGRGFELSSVAADRRGISESIHGRMERSGGSAVIVTEAGAGTEVQLTMANPQ